MNISFVFHKRKGITPNRFAQKILTTIKDKDLLLIMILIIGKARMETSEIHVQG